MLVRRDEFADAGGFPEDVFPGEDTILSHQWGVVGRLAFAGDAIVHHRNRTGLRAFLSHQRKLGVAFAEVCAASDFAHRRFGRRPWAALSGGLRIVALGMRLRGRPAERRQALRLAPLLVIGLTSWSTGVWSASGRLEGGG